MWNCTQTKLRNATLYTHKKLRVLPVRRHIWQLEASLLCGMWSTCCRLSTPHMHLVSTGFDALTKLLPSGARIFQYEYIIAKKRSGSSTRIIQTIFCSCFISITIKLTLGARTKIPFAPLCGSGGSAHQLCMIDFWEYLINHLIIITSKARCPGRR
jgi:hypothetical protein